MPSACISALYALTVALARLPHLLRAGTVFATTPIPLRCCVSQFLLGVGEANVGPKCPTPAACGAGVELDIPLSDLPVLGSVAPDPGEVSVKFIL